MHNTYKSNSREGSPNYSKDIEYELIIKTIQLSHFSIFCSFTYGKNISLSTSISVDIKLN